MKILVNSVHVLEDVEVLDKINRDPLLMKKCKLSDLVRQKNPKRGEYILMDDRFKSMVSITNPPEWAITLGVVKYSNPPEVIKQLRSIVTMTANGPVVH